MSRTISKLKPRLVTQPNLFGGVDLLTLYGEGGRIRSNRQTFATERKLGAAKAIGRDFERAESVCLPEAAPRATCPRCRKGGEVEQLFGFRRMNGRRVRQSWCRQCRRGKTGLPEGERGTRSRTGSRSCVR